MPPEILRAAGIYAAALPVAVSCAILVLAWRSSRLRDGGQGPVAGVWGALALTVAACWALLAREVGVAPGSPLRTVVFVIAAAGLAGWFGLWLRRAAGTGRWWRVASSWTLAGAVCLLAAWLQGRTLVGGAWSARESALWLGGSAALMLAAWAGLERSARATGPSVPLGWLVVALGTAASLGLTGHNNPPLLAGTMAAALGGAAVAGLVRPRLRLEGPAAGAAAATLGSMCLRGSAIGETPVWCGVLLAGACVALGAAAGSPGRGPTAWGWVRTLAAAGVPAAIAVWLAARGQPGGWE